MNRMNRRGFFGRLMGPAWGAYAVMDQALFRAARARAQSKAPIILPKLFDLKKAAEGVYLAQARPQTMVNCNAVIIENATDLMIVDAHSKPSAAASLVRQIRAELTPKPVRYIVASHFHWDHSQGLPAYRKLAPKADILSSEVTRRMIDGESVPRIKQQLELAGRQAEDYKRRAGAATGDDKATLARMARETDAYITEMKGFAPELPNLTLERDLILHDKAHDLHLAFRGRAHTPGDIVVYCPQKKVIASGDMLHASAPFIGDGYPRDWPRTLIALTEFEFDAIAPGHGAVQNGKTVVYQMARYIEELTLAVERARGQGKSVEQTKSEVTVASLKSLADGGYGEKVAQTILGYRMIAPPRPTMEVVLADAVRTNVEQVYQRLGSA
jgi:glyoxylase-like metal-dependent hydrolase (beta-lactamase superfamily II)